MTLYNIGTTTTHVGSSWSVTYPIITLNGDVVHSNDVVDVRTGKRYILGVTLSHSSPRNIIMLRKVQHASVIQEEQCKRTRTCMDVYQFEYTRRYPNVQLKIEIHQAGRIEEIIIVCHVKVRIFLIASDNIVHA